MTSNYVIWKCTVPNGAAVLQDMSGFEKTFRLNNGACLAAEFPADVAFHMHRDFPGDTLLVDNLLNLGDLIVVSEKLKSAIEEKQPAHVEYLPVNIIDHRGRIASDCYFIIHPIDPVARINESASEFKMNLIKKDRIQSFTRFVLDESSIPDDRTIFKLHNFVRITLVRRDLAEALSAGNFSGLEWLEIADYPKD